MAGAFAIQGRCVGGETSASQKENEAPWGEAKDGVVCRLIIGQDYCLGQRIGAAVEIKNISDRERLLLNIFDCGARDRARFTITGPTGKALRQTSGVGYTKIFGPRHFVPLAPGETKRLEYPDLAEFFDGGFLTTGKYAMAFSYFSVKPEKVVYGSQSNPKGGFDPIYEVPTAEEVAKAWAGQLDSRTASFSISAVTKDDLSLHEWGVFTVYDDMRWANAGRKAEWLSLPKFFYRQFPTQRLRWSPSSWDKPIIYFYSRREGLKVNVKVDFGAGTPVVWWPCASSPVNPEGFYGGKAKQVTKGLPFRALEWSVLLGAILPTTVEMPDAPNPKLADGNLLHGIKMIKAEEFALPADCWLNAARAVKNAALVTTEGSNLTGDAPWTSHQIETERFLYYDGLVPAPDFLRCVEAMDATVTLRNCAQFPLKHLFVVDRRGAMRDRPVRFAHLAEALAPGAEIKVPLREIPAQLWPGVGSQEVLAALLEAGLTESEARALLGIWKDGFFLAPGLTAFHLLPQAEYDRMLKLTVSPQPGEIRRVGLALYPHIGDEPELAQTIGELIRRLDDEDVAKREQAAKALGEIGGLGLRYVREAMKTGKSAAVRTRCKAILDNFDTTTYLNQAAKDSGLIKK
jgi:hypothetical protein